MTSKAVKGITCGQHFRAVFQLKSAAFSFVYHSLRSMLHDFRGTSQLVMETINSEVQIPETSITTLTPVAAPTRIYRPLDPTRRQIRIAHLQPGSDTDVVRVQSEVATIPGRHDRTEAQPLDAGLKASASYEAISYVWGDMQRTAPMMLDGVEVLAPYAAVSVLRQFRLPSEQLPFWVDAICINQADLDERQSQVSMMGDIYESATSTRIWLGAETKDSADAVEQCQRVAEGVRRACPKPKPSGTRMWLLVAEFAEQEGGDELLAMFTKHELYKVLDIYSRPWFTRIWTLQEGQLSNSPVCYIGHLRIALSDVTLAAHFLQFAATTEWWLGDRIDGHEPGAPNTLSEDDAHDFKYTLQDVSKLLSTGAAYSGDPTEDYTLSMSDLMVLTKHLSATDPRDCVYALLSLTTWARRRLAFPAFLQPDYRASVAECYCNAVRAAILEKGDLSPLNDTLTHKAILPGPENDLWPTWLQCLPARQDQRVPSRPGHHKWQPVFTSSLDLNLLVDSAIPAVLDLRGYTMDKVTHILSGKELNYLIHASQEHLSRQYSAFEDQFQGPDDLLDFLLRRSYYLIPGYLHEDTLEEFSALLQDEQLDCSGTRDWYDFFDDRTQSSRVAELLELAVAYCAVSKNRTIFLTEQQHVGIGPSITKVGDRVTALLGSRVPVLMRRGDIGGFIDVDVMVGHCCMNGDAYIEALGNLLDKGVETEVFHIY